MANWNPIMTGINQSEPDQTEPEVHVRSIRERQSFNMRVNTERSTPNSDRTGQILTVPDQTGRCFFILEERGRWLYSTQVILDWISPN